MVGTASHTLDIKRATFQFLNLQNVVRASIRMKLCAYNTLSMKGIFLTRCATAQTSGSIITDARPNFSKDSM